MSKIIGVTVGTPTSPSAMAEKLKPVTSINGQIPDENGNVEIEVGSGSGQGGGMSAAAASLLITILRNLLYEDQMANIDALAALLAAGATPDAPPPDGVTQTGSVLTITSGVTVTQDGSTLNIE